MVVVQLVRTPDCGSGGRRFESGLPPKSKPSIYRGFFCCSNLQNPSEITYYNIRIFNLFSALFRHFLGRLWLNFFRNSLNASSLFAYSFATDIQLNFINNIEELINVSKVLNYWYTVIYDYLNILFEYSI